MAWVRVSFSAQSYRAQAAAWSKIIICHRGIYRRAGSAGAVELCCSSLFCFREGEGLRWWCRQRCRQQLPGPRRATQGRRCPCEHTGAALPAPLAAAAARKHPGVYTPLSIWMLPLLPTEAECCRSAPSITYGFTHKTFITAGKFPS